MKYTVMVVAVVLFVGIVGMGGAMTKLHVYADIVVKWMITSMEMRGVSDVVGFPMRVFVVGVMVDIGGRIVLRLRRGGVGCRFGGSMGIGKGRMT